MLNKWQYNILKKGLKNIQSKGLPYLLKELKRFFRGKNEITDLYILDLKNKLSTLPENIYRKKIGSLGNNFDIKILSTNDRTYLDKFIEFAKNTVNLSDVYIDSILKENVCFLALIDNRIVAITCLASNECPFHDFGCNFVLGPAQGYRFESFVEKEYRRKGIMSLLWDYEFAYALNNGYKYLVSAIKPWNKASYIPTLKFGFEKYATVIYKERFFIQRHRFIKLHNSENKIISLRLSSGKVVRI